MTANNVLRSLIITHYNWKEIVSKHLGTNISKKIIHQLYCHSTVYINVSTLALTWVNSLKPKLSSKIYHNKHITRKYTKSYGHAKIFWISRNNLKILGARRVTWRKFHTNGTSIWHITKSKPWDLAPRACAPLHCIYQHDRIPLLPNMKFHNNIKYCIFILLSSTITLCGNYTLLHHTPSWHGT
jgi:hypothetical protein